MAEESVSGPPPISEAPTTSDDGIRIHPHIFSFAIKRSQPIDFKRQLLRRLKGVGDAKTVKFQVEEYATLLSTARAGLLSKLEASPAADISLDVNKSFQDYLSLLVGLVYSAAVSSESQQNSNAVSSAQPRLCMMRDCVTFNWLDAIFSNQGVEAADSMFELASVLIAKVGWDFRRAAYICRDSRPGISTEDAVKAYKLLLSAAGSLGYVQEACCAVLEGKTVSSECSIQAVAALTNIALADAQAVTTLRAMAKNSQPSLVASVAISTSELYGVAANSADTAPFSVPKNKACKYAEYKTAVFRAYALCFTGLDRLKAGEGGQAVRLLEESKAMANSALPIAAAYNKAQPATPAADHAEFDSDLRICIDSALAKAKRENDNLYYKRPPLDVPPLHPAKQLVKAAPFAVPAPHPIILELNKLDAFSAAPMEEVGAGAAGQGGQSFSPTPSATVQSSDRQNGQAAAAPGKGSSAKPEEEEEKPAWWRWLLVIIAMPILAILTVVGIVIWLVLLPVKIICCPIGCLIQIIADVVENLIKAPFKALLWASGKPYKAKDRDIESQ